MHNHAVTGEADSGRYRALGRSCHWIAVEGLLVCMFISVGAGGKQPQIGSHRDRVGTRCRMVDNSWIADIFVLNRSVDAIVNFAVDHQVYVVPRDHIGEGRPDVIVGDNETSTRFKVCLKHRMLCAFIMPLPNGKKLPNNGWALTSILETQNYSKLCIVRTLNSLELGRLFPGHWPYPRAISFEGIGIGSLGRCRRAIRCNDGTLNLMTGLYHFAPLADSNISVASNCKEGQAFNKQPYSVASLAAFIVGLML